MEREIQLQHDIHNDLDRLNMQLKMLDNWNKSTSKFCNENNIKIPSSSVPFIVAEHLRSHIKYTRDAFDKYYQSGKLNKGDI